MGDVPFIQAAEMFEQIPRLSAEIIQVNGSPKATCQVYWLDHTWVVLHRDTRPRGKLMNPSRLAGVDPLGLPSYMVLLSR